jgi:prepilin-type N-terminal cleavage/methylation domain-containing protein
MTRLSWRLRADEGVTLIEMSIVMVLLGAIMAFTLQSVASFQRSASGGVHRIENLNEARILMQVITKDIRTAAKLDASTPPFPDGPSGVYPVDGITRADDNEVLFLANLNQSTQCPKLIRLYIDNVDKLIEAVTEPSSGAPPSCIYPATPTRTRLVGRYIANSPSEPVFTYYYEDLNGALTAFCASATAPGCSLDQTPLTVTDALQVKAIGVRLSIRKDTSLSVADTTIENRVRLPNVYYNPPPEE